MTALPAGAFSLKRLSWGGISSRRGTTPERVRWRLLPFVVSLLFLPVTAASPDDGAAAEIPVYAIRIGGTGGAVGVFEELAGAFRKKNPDVDIVMVTPPLGSTGGIRAVAESVIDVAVTSRPLSDKERGLQLETTACGKTALAFVVNPENPLSGVTLEDLVDIYSGKRSRWPDGTLIRPVLRPSADTHTVLLRGLSPRVSDAVAVAWRRKGLVVASTDDENADLLEHTPGSFGAAPFAQIISEKRRLKPVALSGVEPSVENVAKGSYPLVLELAMVTRTVQSPAVRRFVFFVASPEGRAILRRTGHFVQ